MGSLPIVTIFFESQTEKRGDVSDFAWSVCAYIIPCTAGLFLLFFSNIEKKYRNTFYSLTRGIDLTVMGWNEAEDDAMKASKAFNHSRHHLVSVEGEIRAWVEANWESWDEEKPKWFSEDMRLKIPIEYIPDEARELESGRRTLVADTHTTGGSELGRTKVKKIASALRKVVPLEVEENKEVGNVLL